MYTESLKSRKQYCDKQIYKLQITIQKNMARNYKNP